VQLDRVAAVLRPRTSWEGVELGVAMWQRWWKPVMAAWLFVFLPACAVAVGFWRERLFWPMFVLWWLGPLFDRVVVHVLSRALFGDVPPLITTLREVPRILGRSLLLALTLHRLHPAHALVQPVAQLEGLRGAQRRQREQVLARRTGAIAWLASVCTLLFQVSLTLSAIALLLVMVPSELLPDLRPLSPTTGNASAFDPGWLARAAQIAWIGSYCVTGPLSAAIGFGLYINRRTHLEGWDVEVAFRRLAARVQHQGRRARASVGAVLLFALSIAAFGARATAQDPAQPPTATASAGDKPSEVIARIKAEPEFATKRDETHWEFDFDFQSTPSKFTGLDWLGPLFEFVLWTVLAVLLVVVIVQISKRLGWIEKLRVDEPPAPPPTHLFGLDLRPESLPEDIAAAAWALWSRGEAAAALGLLYRAAISRLVERDGLALESSDTENDCLRRARSLTNAQRAEYFTAVTRAWLTCAYSSARPTNASVEQLCRDWRERFEAAAA
jgi:hypothetical protein